MKTPTRFVFFVAAITAFIFCPAALAQVPQTFVSARNGNDAGNCSAVTSPCRTVSYALSQVKNGGQVLMVDSGKYDSLLVITKDVTIAAAPGVAAVFSRAVPVSSLFGFNYGSSCSGGGSGACHWLTLRNLIFDGQGVTQYVMTAPSVKLSVEDCTFAGFDFGVRLSESGLYQFKNCVFRNLQTAILAVAEPLASQPKIQLVVEGGRFESLSISGITMSTPTREKNQSVIKLALRDTLFNDAGTAIQSIVGIDGSITADLERCEITNSTAAILSLNPGSTVRVSNSTIVGNITGLLFGSNGLLLSRGNNTVEGNDQNGDFTGTFSAR
ncbi:MAG: hypothetical protein ACKVZH_14665 [Blastocatellia bacterium]